MPGEFLNISIEEYLADRGRWSCSTLRQLASEPEAVEKWLRGEDTDNPTRAKARGSVVHCKLLEDESEFRRRFARYPNRNEGLTEEYAIQNNKRTGKPNTRPSKTGKEVPQDSSPAGARKSMVTRSNFEKAFEREWLDAHRGKTIWYPEDEPIVAAMLRAVHDHPQASELLDPNGLAGEVTAHWDCPETGQPMRSRYDGLRIRELRWIEVKTIEPGRHGRIDTMDPSSVTRWIRDNGFAIKSATLHDAFEAVTEKKATGYWIVIEATEDQPRVSVVEDVYDSPLAELGRRGCEDWGIKGYWELARLGGSMLLEGDFRHDCVRELVRGFPLPTSLLTAMQFEDHGMTASAGKAVLGG